MRLISLSIAALLMASCTSPRENITSSSSSNDAAGILVVGNKGEDTVSFINLATGKELARKDSGPMPHEIAISPDKTQVAVVAYGGSSIDFYDAKSYARLDTLDISPNSAPHGLVWLDDNRLLVTTERSRTLTVVSAPDRNGVRTVTGINSQTEGHMVAVAPDYGNAYTADLSSGNIAMIDLRTGKLVKSVPAGPGAEGIAVTNDGTEVWATARETNKAYVYDATTMQKLAEVDIGQFPLRIIASPDGKFMVSSNLEDGTLSVIDVATRKIVRTITVAEGPDSRQVTILFSRDGKRIYAALTGPDKIAEIDFESGTVLRLIDAGRDGDGLAIIPAS